MSKFIDCERNQAFLLPPDLRDWIPEDDLAHFVIEAVERVEMSAFKVNHRGTGSAQYHPRMMLALLIYCYANGIFSSRRIERATHRDIGVRFVAANVHPDHDTIATFRRDNLAAFGESFLQVLLLAKELKLVKVGLVSVDGSKFEASASKHRSVTYERAGELIDQLKLDIADLMERAAAADGEGEDDPQALPKEIARREALCDRLDAARTSTPDNSSKFPLTMPLWVLSRPCPTTPPPSPRCRHRPGLAVRDVEPWTLSPALPSTHPSSLVARSLDTNRLSALRRGSTKSHCRL